MVNAKFTISTSPSANRGYDATHSQTLLLQLEDQPPQDIFKCEYRIGKYSSGAPTPTFTPSNGIASPVGSAVELTMPGSGTHAYEVICTVNNGVDTEGRINPNYTFSRIVVIRSPQDLRKMITAETVEYNPGEGWADTINEMIDQFETAVAGALGSVTNVSGTAPIVITGSPTTTPNVTITPATTLAAGSMSAADKLKLDNATSSNVPSRLGLRGASGEIDFGKVTNFNGGSYIMLDVANLKIESNVAFTIKTLNGTSSQQITLSSGDSTSSASGPTRIFTGLSTLFSTGSIFSITGQSNSSVSGQNQMSTGFGVSSGATLVSSGGCTTGQTGSTTIGTGDATIGTPGNIFICPGRNTGTSQRGNISLGSLAGSFAGGRNVVFLANATTIPTIGLIPTGGIVLFANNGWLYWKDGQTGAHHALPA